MLEPEWDACSELGELSDFLRGKATPRKLRLFACACVRRFRHLLSRRSLRAVEVAERFADGLEPLEALRYVAAAAGELVPPHPRLPQDFAAMAAWQLARPVGLTSPTTFLSCAMRAANSPEANALILGSARRVFGVPSRPVAIAPGWRRWGNGQVISIAERIYQAQDFSGMPVLAEMLEKAGCQDEVILTHCRSCPDHVRGCFVVDAILGKS